MSDTIELESAKFMPQFSSDRQNFQCYRHVALGGKRFYQVLAMPKAFLLIDLPTSNHDGDVSALNLGMAAGLGRLLGGHAGSQIAQMVVLGTAGPKTGIDETYEMAGDEELAAIVKSRRKSLIVTYENIDWATIDPVRAFSTSAGLVRFKAKKVGKIELELIKPHDMMVAVDVFKARLGDRVKVRAVYDNRKLRFVKGR